MARLISDARMAAEDALATALAALLGCAGAACSPAASPGSSADGSSISAAAASAAASAQQTASAPAPSDRPLGPAAWVEIAPAPRAGQLLLSSNVHVFTDRQGVWRCIESRCDHFGDAGSAAPPSLPLRCPISERFAASSDGKVVAQLCDGELAALGTDGTVKRLERHALPEIAGMVVDDRGEVTLSSSVANQQVTIVRVPAEGAPRRVVLSTRSSDTVEPGTGALLAWTTGNGANEAAWFAGTPPIEAAIDGLWLVNGEHLWISLSRGGYRRRTAQAETVVSGSPRGGMPPCGVLLGDRRWGAEGMMFVYERAVLLVDARLERVGMVPLPGGELEVEAFGELHRVPISTSARLTASPDGETLFVTLPDGSIRRWSGPLQHDVSVCKR